MPIPHISRLDERGEEHTLGGESDSLDLIQDVLRRSQGRTSLALNTIERDTLEQKILHGIEELYRLLAHMAGRRDAQTDADLIYAHQLADALVKYFQENTFLTPTIKDEGKRIQDRYQREAIPINDKLRHIAQLLHEKLKKLESLFSVTN